MALEKNDVWPKEAEAFIRYREHLSVLDGVVVCKGRYVVSTALRHRMLECLHSGHQGVSSMELSAKDCVWWPRIYADIQAMRDGCLECIRDALSQATALPEDPPVLD